MPTPHAAQLRSRAFRNRGRTARLSAVRLLTMRLRPSHLLILAAILLLLLAVAGLLQARKWGQAREDHPSATAPERLRALQPGAAGRERCKQKCSALHKGYVYRAQQNLESSGSPHVEPEFCGCV